MMPHRQPARPPVYTAALRHARRQLCERLAHAAGAPDEGFALCYVALMAEVEAHLHQEEVILEACRVQRLQERVHAQRQENAAILSALHHTLAQVENGELATARQLVAALCDILSLHRISADLALPHREQDLARPASMRGRSARAPTLLAPASLRPGRGARSRRT
jgi:hypothetical protein